MKDQRDEIVTKAINDVCECCGVQEERLMSRTRVERIAVARFFLYSILRTEGYGLVEIGQITDRDHGAVCMGIKRLRMRLRCNERLLLAMRAALVDCGWNLNGLEMGVKA